MQTSPPTPHIYPGEAAFNALTPLDRLDRVLTSLSPGHPVRSELLELRSAVSEQESTMAEAREAIEKMEQIINKLTAPANRIGTFLGTADGETAQLVVGGADYYCNADPRTPLASLKRGTRVLVNEAFVIVGDLGYGTSGPVAKVVELLPEERLRVGSEHGIQNLVLERSADLAGTTVRTGDEVRVDANFRVALEVLSKGQGDDYYLDAVPELPWEKVGGQHEALDAIRDAVEMPLLHGELFRKYAHAAPKGFLLYGPPGCGKTLIGKATAYNLTARLKEKEGVDTKEYFMHIKGPEILNMWVGESERIVREIFSTAREKRREGYLPFLFIDEAESILGTRRATRQSSILSTLVPMFCAEMDGIDSLNDVVIILASNRADLIDPAILRPGRIDRKIKVRRPTREGSAEIYRIYLEPTLPYAPELMAAAEGDPQRVVDGLVEKLLDWQFARTDANRFLEVTLRSGRKEVLYRGDLVSGAVIASIVERAKALAIKRAIATGQPGGISECDLHASLDAEYLENDIFPPTDITEDWLKLIDYDSENVVRVAPIRYRPMMQGSSEVI
ncbi:MAG TPA: AAA family ATPase [Chthoniobacteraceae bacterium]|nr:AAA family ATPase [Chthoniobacteraceae bacterium]